MESTLLESYDADWTRSSATYNGVSCTEFTGVIEDSGMTFDATAAFCYLSDMYLVVMYMPFDADYTDYYDAMYTITYE